MLGMDQLNLMLDGKISKELLLGNIVIIDLCHFNYAKKDTIIGYPEHHHYPGKFGNNQLSLRK